MLLGLSKIRQLNNNYFANMVVGSHSRRDGCIRACQLQGEALPSPNNTASIAHGQEQREFDMLVVYAALYNDTITQQRTLRECGCGLSLKAGRVHPCLPTARRGPSVSQQYGFNRSWAGAKRI